ncbi:hypothetical protein [Thermococcus sp.]|uniref:hypothetical protein n=1 Tax=Thermococcus sp. TaxID=35749 RepID=UPI00262E91F9|nr:hypothetical protein [Thermococcus sp.]
MGSRVEALEKELKGSNLPLTLFILLISTPILGIYYFWDAFRNTESTLGIIAGLVSTIGVPIALVVVAYDLLKLKADPQKFVEAYRKDEAQTSEIEILEKAYSKAHDYVSEAFRDTLILWLGLGFITALVEIAVITGSLEVKDSTRFWVLIGLSSLLSVVSFILMIIFYLRKRSIEKALFAIQLKKTDKAELSIKL